MLKMISSLIESWKLELLGEVKPGDWVMVLTPGPVMNAVIYTEDVTYDKKLQTEHPNYRFITIFDMVEITFISELKDWSEREPKRIECVYRSKRIEQSLTPIHLIKVDKNDS